MQFRDARHNSPNHVLLAVAVALVVASVFCARSLWIPASRIENLHVRAVVLSVTEAVAAYASTTGLDDAVPRLRSSFLGLTGLSEHSSWDSRYFNRRNGSSNREDVVTPKTAERLPDSTETVPVPETLPGMPDGIPDGMTAAAEAPAVAAEAPAAPLVSSRIYSRDNPLPVYFFGDSQVFSLASGLSRLAGKDSAIDIDFLAIHSSGFIRDDFYDWPRKLEDTLADKSTRRL